MSFNERMDKLWFILNMKYHSFSQGMNYHCTQVEWISRIYEEWKKPISQSYLLYDSVYISFSKYQNYRDREQISDCQGLEMGGLMEVGMFFQKKGNIRGPCDNRTVLYLNCDGGHTAYTW